MKTFLTKKIGSTFAGLDIYAVSLREAEILCPDGYEVIGELIETIEGNSLSEINLN